MSLEEAVKFVAGAYAVILVVLFAAYATAARRVATLSKELQTLRAAAERRLGGERGKG